MSEYTRAVFGSLAQGEADFARIYAQVQETTQTLESQLNSSLQQWDGQAKEARGGQGEVAGSRGEHGGGAQQPARGRR